MWVVYNNTSGPSVPHAYVIMVKKENEERRGGRREVR